MRLAELWQGAIFFIIVLILVKNITCGGALRSISRLAPAPGQSST
jgi:hypothetical protein